jgi:uncharacterized membrane protein YedE/YeeE
MTEPRRSGRPTKAEFTALLSGALFGAGLVISGMTDPANIQGFLDVMGDFRPNLALVMVGALVVYGVAIRRFRATSLTEQGRPTRIDGPLLVGAGVFGVGWGLGGYCPGPSVVAVGAGRLGAGVFVAASIAGLFLADALRATLERKGRQEPGAVDPGEVAETV